MEIKAHWISVIGQHQAEVIVAVYNRYKRLENVRLVEEKQEEVEIQKSNLLLIGTTGTDKTHDGTNFSQFLNVPFVVAIKQR